MNLHIFLFAAFLFHTTFAALPTLPPNIGAREQGAIITFKDCMADCDRFPYNQGALDRCMTDCRNNFSLEIPAERNEQWPSSADTMLKTLKRHE